MNEEEVLKSFYIENQLEAGCDEAGRGCLVGPVVAAAVILPADFKHEWLNDSKQLTEKRRAVLRPIIEKEAISWSVSFVDHHKVDEINILNASILAMHQAVNQLDVKPDFLLIDGNRFHAHTIPHACFVKGDARFKSIAAASILAKTHRDEYMDLMHQEHPVYEWNKNKGYATKKHREAIGKFGVSPFQRTTFAVKID
ncbi:MAG: ribonuclease HII [Crocinitomicaceae bacterium]|nr:ribonuclease HII [Crocinitomicaceae bacterium]